jgi:hypothetical protein
MTQHRRSTGDVLRLPFAREGLGSLGFRFGDNTLWIDHVPSYGRSRCMATDPHCRRRRHRPPTCYRGVPLREEVEPYADVEGYWISDPSGVIIRLSPPE